MSQELVYSVTDFVAVCNQILDLSFGAVQITGELANFKISKNRWVYFDLKDDYSSVRFFGTVYQLPGPLEDGMILTVRGAPQLHPKFGFSVTIQAIQLAGEGTIKKAAHLLEQRLAKEGLFDEARKRPLPYPPAAIGIISSTESAGYADFVKIMNERWGGLKVQVIDVQVQGEKAPAQIIEAIQYFNQHVTPVEVLVVIRGGGSADDLQAFSHEGVTRAVASSRIPTLVAIGHETDISLAEMAADLHASTPSNAAQLLLPDKRSELEKLKQIKQTAALHVQRTAEGCRVELEKVRKDVHGELVVIIDNAQKQIKFLSKSLALLNPQAILKRGYVVVRQGGNFIRSAAKVDERQMVEIQFYDGVVKAEPQKSGTL